MAETLESFSTRECFTIHSSKNRGKELKKRVLKTTTQP
jgi:hypothetical protein